MRIPEQPTNELLHGRPSVVAWILVIGLFLGATSTFAGPWPDEIGRWTEEEKDRQREAGARLQADMAAAIERGDKVFQIAPGNYRFADGFRPGGSYAIVLSKVNGLAIEGNQANFFVEWKSTGHSLGAIMIQDSTDIAIRGITIDWDPIPFTQGKIVKTFPEKHELLWKPDPGYETIPPSMKFPHDQQNPQGGGMRSYLYDRTTGRLLPQVRMTLKAPGRESTYNHPEPDGSYRLATGKPNGTRSYTPEQMGLVVGAKIVSHHRGSGTPFWIWNSARVVVEDVVVYSSPNMVVKGKFGGGAYEFRRVRAIRRPGTDRLAVSNADGFQISEIRRGPIIEDCRFEAIGDDFINVGDVSDDGPQRGGAIRNNVFTTGIARGILARASNLLIENNRITNTLEAGIAITECKAIHNLVIRGNYIEDTCSRSICGVGLCPYTTGAAIEMWGRDPAKDPVKSDILIEGNTIVHPRGSAVSVVSARNVRVVNNRFDGCGSYPWIGKGRQPEQYGIPVAIYPSAAQVEVRDNEIINIGPYSLDQ